MNKLLAIAVAALAISFLSVDVASAQIGSGYGFGVGANYGSFPYPGTRANNRDFHRGGAFFGGGFLPTPRIDEPPYFAKYPPVYYSGIVARPYGVSPYAAPPGIVPVEMSTPVAPVPPVTIRNPYFDSEVETVVEEMPAVNNRESNQTTRFVNPYLDTVTINE